MTSKAQNYTCAGCGGRRFGRVHGGPDTLPLCRHCHVCWVEAGMPDDLDCCEPKTPVEARVPNLKPKVTRASPSRKPTVNLIRPYVWRDPKRGWRPEDRTGEATKEERPDGPQWS
jgi:hypothetical protein